MSKRADQKTILPKLFWWKARKPSLFPQGMPLGVYVDAQSPVHAIPAASKFFLLIVFIVAVTLSHPQWPISLLLVAAMVFLYALARIPARTAWQQIWPALPFVFFLSLFPLFTDGWQWALSLTAQLMTTIMAAVLVTLTTRVTAMMDSLEKALAPLAKIGLHPDRISLALSLTIRLIPLQLDTIRQVLEAQKARGGQGSLLAFGVPVIVRSIKRAEVFSDALIARGAISE